MIERVRFENFKALRDVTIELSPFTLIVGPNASGKTSVLEGLECLTRAATEITAQVLTGKREPALLRSSGATGRMIVSARGVWNGRRASLSLTASEDATKQGRSKWILEFGTGVSGPDGATTICSSEGEARVRLVRDLPAACRAAMFLRLDPGRLAEPAFTKNLKSSVGPDGWGLAAVLADMAITEPQEFQKLQTNLKAVVPSVSAVRFQKSAIETVQYEDIPENPEFCREVRTRAWGYELVLDCATGSELPGHLISEGTLLTLGLLTALSREPRPQLVLVDELERGLHPKALGELVRQIRALMARFPDLQVIATTHSPYLVDHFSADEVRLTTMRDDGSVVAGKLNDHPDFERWKDEMKPGEFWSTVGEDWLRERKGPDGG